MHLVYCVIGVKGGLKGWTVLRCGAERKREGTKGKRAKGKATNKKQKHKAQESRHQKYPFWGEFDLVSFEYNRTRSHI